jgi:hypothetical protein
LARASSIIFSSRAIRSSASSRCIGIGRWSESTSTMPCPGSEFQLAPLQPGMVQFVPTLGGRMLAGFSDEGWPSTAPSSMRHAFSFWPDGGWDIREFGQYRADGRFVQGDVFRIAVENFQVLYYRNNTLLYRSDYAPWLPARLDTSFLSAGSEIRGAIVQTGAA